MAAFSSFASDGASVMIGAFLLLLFFKLYTNFNIIYFKIYLHVYPIGKKSGVGKRLTEMYPGVITVHCVCHRLNLAVSDCISQTKRVPYLRKYARTLGTIFWFYHGSSNRTGSLQEMDLPQIKLQVQ